MHYTDEDYRALYNTRNERERKRVNLLPWLVAALIAVIFGILGTIDYADAIDADTAQKEALAASLKTQLSFPIPWTATVELRTHYDERPKVRYYAPKERK